MNKDVIYIEPEDDITDIITKIKNTKERIVALVPPKKSVVLRSIVNIKLIAKSGAAAEKSVVLVTTDPAVLKLAGAVKLPVAKSLQSAPAIPTVDELAVEDTTATENLVKDGNKVRAEAAEAPEEAEAATEEVDEADDEPTKEDSRRSTEEGENEAEKGAEDGAKDAKSDKDNTTKGDKSTKKGKLASKNQIIAWILDHKKITIPCGIGVVVLILVLIWAFAIAPAATITVDLRTATNNFSENANFTLDQKEEDASKGVFYLVEKKLENRSEVEFEATGSKNVGQKASGEVIIYAYFKNEGAIAVNSGSIFEYDGMNFISQKDVTLVMSSATKCDNSSVSPAELLLSGCLVSARVPVVAENPGTKYNVGASDRGWKTSADVSAYTDKAMAGGTDETITIVSQSDVDAAKKKLASNNESEDKKKLIESVPEGNLAINSSFSQSIGEAVSTPAVGEKVEAGQKAKLSVITTNTIFYVDNTKIEEFIHEKAKLADNYKIYSMNDPFVENFLKTDAGYTGKIKTSYISGPEVTENSIIEVVKGKGIGTAQHDLSEINGIGKIRIDTSYPWVSSIPGNPEKITVVINVDEKDTSKDSSEDSSKDSSDEGAKSSTDENKKDNP